jgi:hypothetical protein
MRLALEHQRSLAAGEHKHKLAKVGVEGSNPFARSRFLNDLAII